VVVRRGGVLSPPPLKMSTRWLVFGGEDMAGWWVVVRRGRVLSLPPLKTSMWWLVFGGGGWE